MHAALGVKVLAVEAHSITAILDTDGDGVISKSELASAITDMAEYQKEVLKPCGLFCWCQPAVDDCLALPPHPPPLQLLQGMETGNSIQILSEVASWICSNRVSASRQQDGRNRSFSWEGEECRGG